MNKAQGCLLGWQECFPLATSIPCPPRHPLSDINFPTPVYSRVADGQTKAQRGEASPRCRRVNRSSGCQARAGNQTWGAHGLHPQLQLLCSNVTQDRTQGSLFPRKPPSGSSSLHPHGALGPLTCTHAAPRTHSHRELCSCFFVGCWCTLEVLQGSELVLPIFQAPLNSSSLLACRKVKLGCCLP